MAKKQPSAPKPDCEKCRHAYDFNSKAHDGRFILCRCKYYTDGKFCKFTRGDGCAKYWPK